MSRRRLCIVQARTSSTRLPGKVIAEVAGRPLLALMLDRLQHVAMDDLVVATSTLPGDDPVAAIAESSGVAAVRGPLDDVLARFALALDRHPADAVCRLTADCPLVDPEMVGHAFDLRDRLGSDHLSNALVRTFPDGLDVEVITASALRAAAAEATGPREREHVTPFITRRPRRFRLDAFRNDEDLSRHRWTVDTEQDLEVVRQLAGAVADPVRALWRDFLRVAPPAPTAPDPHLSTACAVDRAAAVRPIDDPARRTWTVVDGGRRDGWVGIDVDAGVAQVTVDPELAHHLVPDVIAELVQTAGSQVVRFVLPGNSVDEGALGPVGFEPEGRALVLQRSP